MEKESFIEILRGIPKAEIHLHLEDFIAGQAVREQDISSLNKFIEVYHSLLDSLRTIEDLDVAFRNIVSYMQENGIVYAEVFFSPVRYIRKMDFQYVDLVRFLDRRVKGIRGKHGLTIKLIPDMSRTYGPDAAMAVLEMMTLNPSSEIIGVGLGAGEDGWQNKDYIEVFKKAREHGLRTVAHAGESVGPQSILDAVMLLKAERIGHATSAAQNPAILELLVEKQIPLEISVTSNLVTGAFVKSLEDHPVREYLERGAFITINTDDPTLFNTNLIKEYWKLHNKMGFRLQHIYQMIVNGFMASFMSEDKKHDYIRQVKRKWNRGFLLTNRRKAAASWMSGFMNIFEGKE